MTQQAFLNYATSPGLSDDEVYTIERLIDRVRLGFEEYSFERSKVKDKARAMPWYMPAFSHEDLEAAAESICKLHWLSFQRCDADERPVVSLVPLRFLPELETLVLSGNEASDLSPLGEIPSLRALNIRRNPVRDLSPLKNCHRLQELELDEFSKDDWTVLQHMKALRELDISFESLEKFRQIPVLPALQSCDITCIGEVIDSLEGFPAMPELRVLHGLKLASLKGLENYPLLENLVNFSCLVDSLEPLRVLIQDDEP